jgi:hypothetical protein|tara:strand:+ start:45 stop:149 length:105 start_codon:yes stop_codon:yes gene_type:complete
MYGYTLLLICYIIIVFIIGKHTMAKVKEDFHNEK